MTDTVPTGMDDEDDSSYISSEDPEPTDEQRQQFIAIIQLHCGRSVHRMHYKEMYDHYNALEDIRSIDISMAFVPVYQEEFLETLAASNPHIKTLKHLYYDKHQDANLLADAMEYFLKVMHAEELNCPDREQFQQLYEVWEQEREGEVVRQDAIMDGLKGRLPLHVPVPAPAPVPESPPPSYFERISRMFELL